MKERVNDNEYKNIYIICHMSMSKVLTVLVELGWGEIVFDVRKENV